MSKKNITLKKWHFIALGIVAVVALVYGAYQTWYWPKAEIKIGDKNITVLVANTAYHQHLGWSGRKDMGRYDGMIFICPDYNRHPMVMRGMLFPLDMVWLNDGQVVDMAPNVQPEEPDTPENLLKLYMSRQSANAVLELPVGTIGQTGLKIGDRVEVVKN